MDIWHPSVYVSKEGYYDKPVHISKSFQPVGTGWGFLIDIAAGDMMKINNHQAMTTLSKK